MPHFSSDGAKELVLAVRFILEGRWNKKRQGGGNL